MIDLHVHILPGLDDGPSTMDEALDMASIAVKDGIKTVIATPHCLNGVYDNDRETILKACSEFNHTLKKYRIPLTVLPGSEVHLNVGIQDALERGWLMTLNDTRRYFFLELPGQFMRGKLVDFVVHLKKGGVVPIIAHPERNMSIQRDITLLRDLISAGALSQITARSLEGGFGFPAQKCCLQIIEQKLAHFFASDAHSSDARPPILSRAAKKLVSLVGKDRVRKMVLEGPQRVIDGKSPGWFFQ